MLSRHAYPGHGARRSLPDWGSIHHILRRAEASAQVTAGMNDVVVHRLFSAGLSLDAALG